jgi:hypothetical protein
MRKSENVKRGAEIIKRLTINCSRKAFINKFLEISRAKNLAGLKKLRAI